MVPSIPFQTGTPKSDASISGFKSILHSESLSWFRSSPEVYFPLLLLLLLHWEAGTNPTLLFEPPRPRHPHVPPTCLFVEHGLQHGVVIRLVGEDVDVTAQRDLR